jgi:Asp-tRNA(Asn)/Glu-tRNA(Gln) amidotransferase A subunit family amidase
VGAGAEDAGALATVGAALERAAASELGSFWALDHEGALRSAERAGAGALGGVTVAVKDCFDVAGLPTTAGVARDRPAATADAEAVARLRAAGAVVLGKAALDQLAWTTFAYAPGFPDCRNPVDPELTPGGSSSGPAVAVAAGLAELGLGSDIAGSIRIPAACCGLVGLRPPPGWIPLSGCAAFAPTFDCGGVVARSLPECVAAVEALAGRPLPARTTGPVRVGLLADELELAHPDVADGVRAAAATLTASGAELLELRLRDADDRPGTQGMGKVLAAELETTWGAEVREAPELFGDEVRGSIAFAAELSPAEVEAARAELERARGEAAERLAACEVVLGPTLHTAAPRAADPGTVAELTAATRPFSAFGWAAVSLPAGSDRSGRPVAVQLAAAPERVGTLLGVAALLSR